MTINIKKTKAMVVSKKPNSRKIDIAIDGHHIEQVTYYMYLRSLITEDGRSEKEIKRRRMIARTKFTNMRTFTIIAYYFDLKLPTKQFRFGPNMCGRIC